MRYSSSTYLVLLFTLMFSSLTLAEYAEYEGYEEGYFQLKASGGLAWLSTQNAELEIDNVDLETSNWDSADAAGLASLGVGYMFPLTQEEGDFRWFPAIVASIDGTYQFETELEGDLNKDHFDNRANLENLTLMYNVTFAIAEYQRWTAFILGGVGIAWTWVDYQDNKIALKKQESTTFAIQGGGGVGYELIPELDLTLTYLYADLGGVNTSEKDLELSNEAKFDLRQQSVLLGLTWNFI